MERNYPTLYLYGKDDTGDTDAAKVRIAFSRERKGPQDRDEPDWICKMVRTSKSPYFTLLISTVQHQQLRYTPSMFQMSSTQSR
jgi:hypothetical protein